MYLFKEWSTGKWKRREKKAKKGANMVFTCEGDESCTLKHQEAKTLMLTNLLTDREITQRKAVDRSRSAGVVCARQRPWFLKVGQQAGDFSGVD